MLRLKDEVKHILIIILGTMLCAVASNMFYAPNKIVGGGITGIAVILYHTLSIPLSVTLTALNSVLFVAAFFVLGKSRIFKLLFGTVCYIVMTELFSIFPAATDNLVLAAVFGGVLDGIGLAIIFLSGGNTGGNDILAMMIRKKVKHLGVGRLIFFIDAVIITCSFIVFGDIELTLYGIMLVFIYTFVIDKVIEKLNISKFAIVITEEGTAIASKILNELSRGVTLLDGFGGFAGRKKNILMCAMKDKDMPALTELVSSIDNRAFTIFLEAKHIAGNGFKIYK